MIDARGGLFCWSCTVERLPGTQSNVLQVLAGAGGTLNAVAQLPYLDAYLSHFRSLSSSIHHSQPSPTNSIWSNENEAEARRVREVSPKVLTEVRKQRSARATFFGPALHPVVIMLVMRLGHALLLTG